MLLIVFASIILLALLSDIYIWLSFLRTASHVCQVLHFLPTACIVALLLVIFSHGPSTKLFHGMFFVLLCFVLPKLLFTAFSLTGRGIGAACPPAFGAMNVLGLCVATIVAVGGCYGLLWGWKRLVVKPQTIVCDTLPNAFDGFKVVQLSDLHISTFKDNPDFVERMVEQVNAQHPDLIVFTGDLVTQHSEELRPFATTLSRLKARHGVLSILGNHDYAIYGKLRNDPRAREADKQQLVTMQRQMGWTVLLNEHRIFRRGNSAIAVIGVENEGKEGGIHRARLQDAMKGTPTDAFCLLLTHDPEHWRKEIVPKTAIPLTLAGHTHAGHFRIGNFSLAKWMAGPEWGGLYSDGAQQLFVSAGIGGSLPFRLGAWPEINVITLRQAK